MREVKKPMTNRAGYAAAVLAGILLLIVSGCASAPETGEPDGPAYEQPADMPFTVFSPEEVMKLVWDAEADEGFFNDVISTLYTQYSDGIISEEETESMLTTLMMVRDFTSAEDGSYWYKRVAKNIAYEFVLTPEIEGRIQIIIKIEHPERSIELFNMIYSTFRNSYGTSTSVIYGRYIPIFVWKYQYKSYDHRSAIYMSALHDHKEIVIGFSDTLFTSPPLEASDRSDS
jgi:hypothetical protein